MENRIQAQLAFLTEADKLKSVTRANVLADGSRFENSAEHSWHLCLWAVVFEDQSGGANIARVIQMLLLHDLVEIDAGDHPIHLERDEEAIAKLEQAAAKRLFGLLPADQAVNYRLLWDEFEEGKSADAHFARMIDKAVPMFLELSNPVQTQNEHDILRSILETGRFADLHDDWPEVYQHASNLLNKRKLMPLEPLASRLRFVMEADQLKSVLRGTTICDGSRHENSAEHSWHIMLWALTLAEHSHEAAKIDRVLMMLLIHDIVEIDAGDNPLHGDFDANLREIWEEFEAATTVDAVFAKSLDRAQPLVCNLESGGGSWRDYNVTRDQVQSRVGVKVKRGAPALWDALAPHIDAWFLTNAQA